MRHTLIAFLAFGFVAFTGCADSTMSKGMHSADCNCEKCVAMKDSRSAHPVGCTCDKCTKDKMDAKK